MFPKAINEAIKAKMQAEYFEQKKKEIKNRRR